MRFTDRLSMAQRIVVVVALGLALGAIGSYLDSLGNGLWAVAATRVLRPAAGEPPVTGQP